jgi:PAS domain S-box-containing protein
VRKYFPVILVVAIGAVFSVASFTLVRDLEQARIEAEIEQHIDGQLHDLQHSIDVHLDQLHAIRAFFAASVLVERAEFATFVRPQEARHPAIQALEWVPRVLQEERAGFEGAARGEGFPEFAFRELDADGKLVEAAPRDEYFPVYFVEPLAGNEAALGYDVYSDPAGRAALEKARDTGSAAATGRIRLVQETAGQPGFLVFLPIYRSGMPRGTVDERRNNLHGFALGVLRIGDLVDDAVRSLGKRGLEVYFFDQQADASKRFLDQRPLQAEAAPLEPLTEAAVGAISPWAKKIRVADRTWTVLFRPSPEFLATQRGGRAWVVLLVGLAFTAVATAFLVGSRKRMDELRSLAGQVSVALADSVEENSTYVVLKIAFILFMGEGLIMLSFPWQILAASLWTVALIDAFFLIVIASPFIYFWVIRPHMGSMRIALTALRESEGRYRALYDQNPTMFFTTGADGTVLSANQFGASHLGYAVDELVGNSVLKLFADNFKSYARDHLNECLSAPESLHRWEIQKVRKDGTPLWVSETARVVRDSGGTPNVLIVCQDITERKRAEEAVERLVRQNELILNAAGEGIYGLDLEGRTTFCNPAAAAMIGWEPEELIGKPQHAILHHSKPDGSPYPQEECPIYAAFGDGAVHHVSNEVFWRKDGTSFPVEYVSTPIREGDDIVGAVVVFRDITARKRAEEALRESEERFRGAFETAAHGMTVIAPDSSYIAVNPTFCRITGYSEAELLAQKVQDITHPDDMEEDLASLQRLLAGEIPSHQMEKRYIHKQGHVVWIQVSVSLVRDSVGKPMYFVSHIQDITERKKAEEALRLSEASLANAQRMARLGNWDWNLVTNELYCSDETYRIFGLEPQRSGATVETFLESIHPEDRHFVEESISKTLFEKAPYSVDYRVVHPDGQQETVHAQGEVDYGDAGNPVRMAGTVQDITERKKAERALESLVTREICIAQLGQRALANEGLEQLFHYATAFVAQVLDIELCKVLELRPDRKNLLLKAGVGWKVGLLGKATVPVGRDSQAGYTLLSSEPVIVDDLSAESRFSGPPLLFDHGVVSGISVIIGAPGRPYGVLGAHTVRRRRFTRDDTNFLQAVGNVLADAIERRRVEDAVRDSEERVRLLLESTGEAIFGADTNARCTFCNPSCVRLLGYTDPNDLLGKDMHELMHHTRSDGTPYPKDECRIYQAFKTGKAVHVDDEVLWRADGTSFPAEYRARVMRRDGKIVGAVVTFTDITERRRRQAEVIQASKLATLGELTTGVAHELNQPLSVIRMAAERVMDGLESGEVDRDFLSERMERIASQIERAGTIIDHMRIFGRPASEEKTRFDPRVAVEGALSLLGEQLRLRNIEVRTDVPKSCLPVVGSEVQLEQVLLNLLANARDAIEARFAQAHEEDVQARVAVIKVRCYRAKRRVQISVRNTGVGIPDSLTERIFEPFVTTKEKGKGTGLGLSISQDIVMRMGGTIRARNVVGGAEFTITLPAAEPVDLPSAERSKTRAYS